MKEYIIRKVGWAYDDSDYQYDGESGIVDWFVSKKEAIAKAKMLNRRYLLSNFWQLAKYDLEGQKTIDYVTRRKKLDAYLVDELGFNPTIKLYPQFKNSYDFGMFLKPPSDEQVDKIVELSGIEFFRVIEVDKEYPIFYKAYIVADYIFRQEKVYLHHRENYEHVLFNRQIDAFKSFKNHKYNFQDVFSSRSEKSILNGTPEKLSLLPRVFEDFIARNKGLSYEKEKLNVSGDIDILALQQLNELLKKPFLQFEEVTITDDLIVEEGTVYQAEINKEFTELEFRNHRLRTLEKLKESEGYLYNFYFELPRYRSNYSNILNRYFEKYIKVHLYLHHKRHPICRGVITEAIEKKDSCKVTSIFKINRMEESLKSTGTGKTLEEAFENSFDNWLEVHQEVWVAMLTADE